MRKFLLWLSRLFLLAGVLILGVCGFFLAQAALYQSYGRWAFEQSLKGAPVSVGAFLGERLPLPAGVRKFIFPPAEALPSESAPDSMGSWIGTIDIPSLELSAMVLEGVDARALRVGVGHIPGTSLPGRPGKAALAGHRDTYFRKLRHIRPEDTITLTTEEGASDYVVESIVVVDPTDVHVLESSGEPLLTLVTCYPFDFVGPAPKRFVVHARKVGDGDEMESLPAPDVSRGIIATKN